MREFLLIMLLLTAALAKPAWANNASANAKSEGSLREVVEVFRPLGCLATERRLGRRKLWECKEEERKKVTLLAGRIVLEEPMPNRQARNPYPAELTRVWRSCPLSDVAQLDALPALFNPYQDLDISRCYILDPFDRERLGQLKRGQGVAKAQTLLPYFAGVVERMVVFSAEQGWDLRIASAQRSSSSKVVVVKVKIKVRGKTKLVKRKKTVSTKGIHAWGLAVDVLFLQYTSLKKATSDYNHDASWRRKWLQLAEFAEQRGVFWLGHEDDTEIAHFEFHPGWASYPTGPVRERILHAERSQGYRAVWQLLKPQAGVAEPFEHLRDPLSSGASDNSPGPKSAL